jgi:hypothetical protein
MKETNLIAQREHLKEAIEGDRKILSEMWKKGIRDGWLYEKIHERRERNIDKVAIIGEKLCPWPA